MGGFGFGRRVTSAGAHASPATVALTQAGWAILPAARTPWAIVCVLQQLAVSLGASVAGVAGVHVNPSSGGVSSTETFFNVTLPVLVATIVYVITSPTLL